MEQRTQLRAGYMVGRLDGAGEMSDNLVRRMELARLGGGDLGVMERPLPVAGLGKVVRQVTGVGRGL
jgi:hypothetical protein